VRWKFKTDWEVSSSPAVCGALVYVGSEDQGGEDDYLCALDGATGTVRWKFTAGDFVESSPAVSGGLVYVGSDDGYLYALK
jgi:outer membrane protein assembly factor BamB